MTFDDLDELHNICHVNNLASILQNGILSHERVKKLSHTSVAMPEIQDRRAKVVVPNANRKLHSYANLYFYARNKMMFKINSSHQDLCVIRVDKQILKDQRAVIADQNASSNYVRFAPGRDGLRLIDKNTVFARSWKHPNDQIAEWRHGAAMCAELLIPDCVPAIHIKGVYVSCEGTAVHVRQEFPNLDVVIHSDLFFR